MRFSVLTVSDSRTLENDESGRTLADGLVAAGHCLVERRLVRDEPLEILSAAQSMVQDATGVDVLLVNGGTGIAPRDRTPEALRPWLDRELPGFGELFRMLSFQEVGSAAILSRALAGTHGSVFVALLPGSVKAVRLAVEKILLPELPHIVKQLRG